MATCLVAFYNEAGHFYLMFIQTWSVFTTGYRLAKFKAPSHQILTVSCALPALLIFFLKPDAIFAIKMGLVAILAAFYNGFPKLQLRNFPFLKIFHVGAVWSLITAWLYCDAMSWPVFFSTLFFISGLIIPFDIRDQEADVVLTVPKYFGSLAAKFISCAFIFLSFVFAKFVLPAQSLLAFSVALGIAVILIFLASANRKNYYYSVFLEACSGLPFLILQFIKYF